MKLKISPAAYIAAENILASDIFKKSSVQNYMVSQSLRLIKM